MSDFILLCAKAVIQQRSLNVLRDGELLSNENEDVFLTNETGEILTLNEE